MGVFAVKLVDDVHVYKGRFFYVHGVGILMETAKVNTYIMHIFGKIEFLSIHAT